MGRTGRLGHPNRCVFKLCGGLKKWNAHAYNLLRSLASEEGGLHLNWCQVGFDKLGHFGINCLTCNDGVAHTLTTSGHPGSSPFLSFASRHCNKVGKHLKARAALAAQINSYVICLPAEQHAAMRPIVGMLVLAHRISGTEPAPPSAPTGLRAPVGSERLQPATRNSAAWKSQVLEEEDTHQSLLDESISSGAFKVTGDGLFAVCQRCPKPIDLRNPNWQANATAHWATHPSTGGMQTLDAFGIVPCQTRLCDAARQQPSVDPSTLCHGMWQPQVVYCSQVYDATSLLDDLKAENNWYPEPHFSRRLSLQREPGLSKKCSAVKVLM